MAAQAWKLRNGGSDKNGTDLFSRYMEYPSRADVRPVERGIDKLAQRRPTDEIRALDPMLNSRHYLPRKIDLLGGDIATPNLPVWW